MLAEENVQDGDSVDCKENQGAVFVAKRMYGTLHNTIEGGDD